MKQPQHALFKIEDRLFVEVDESIWQRAGLKHGDITTQMLTPSGEIVIARKEVTE